MNKKIVSFLLAALMLFGITSMAEEGTPQNEAATHKAVLLIYNTDNTLVYVKTLEAKNGVFDYGVVPQSYGTKRKLYFIDTDEVTEVQSPDGSIPEYTTVPDPLADVTEPTATPEATTAPTAAPEATAAPTATPKASDEKSNSPYPKEADGIYAPAVVTEVGTSVNSKDEEVYSVTVLYQGEEITVGIPETLEIATAPEAHADVKGENALALEKGDVICMTANVAGNKIKRVDLIYRPVKEDIVTGGVDYGDNFEKLFTTGGSVAGQWSYLKYGEKPSKDKYQYAFGIVAGRSGNTITLLNTSGVTADELDIDVSPNAYVYSTEVTGKEYDFDIEGVSAVTSSLPKRLLSEDVAALDDTYTYNYALVRLVEDTATDIVIYKDYND